MNIGTSSFEETEKLGQCLAKYLRAGMIVCFFGEMGTGKTTMIRGIAKGLGIDPEIVHSPTFTLMNVYDRGRKDLYHFDLYRLDSIEDLIDIGSGEFLYGEGVSVVEWAEKFGKMMPRECLEVHLRHRSKYKRNIRLKAAGAAYEKLLLKVERL